MSKINCLPDENMVTARYGRKASKTKSTVLAGAVVASATMSAHGALVYHDNTDITITDSYIYVNLDAGTVSTTASATVGDDDIQFAAALAGANSNKPDAAAGQPTGSNTLITGINIVSPEKFSYGQTIAMPSQATTFFSVSEQASFAPPPGYVNHWLDGTPGYLGFSFSSGGQTLYGWAQLSWQVDPGADPSDTRDDVGRLTLYDYGYDDLGAPVFAGGGAVPEPSTMGMLAAALAGSLTLHRKRQAKSLAV